ncbi:hypothetical protein NPIL_405201, partial [Nephila pilipes]
GISRNWIYLLNLMDHCLFGDGSSADECIKRQPDADQSAQNGPLLSLCMS